MERVHAKQKINIYDYIDFLFCRRKGFVSILTMFSSMMYINIPMKIYFLLKKGVVFNLELMLVKKGLTCSMVCKKNLVGTQSSSINIIQYSHL